MASSGGARKRALHPAAPPPYDELAVDSPYLSFADNVFNKYRNYYHMHAPKGTAEKDLLIISLARFLIRARCYLEYIT